MAGGGGAPARGPAKWWPRPADAVLLQSRAVMGNIFAIVAFAVLWILLGVFFFVVLRALLTRGKAGDKGRWEHGL